MDRKLIKQDMTIYYSNLSYDIFVIYYLSLSNYSVSRKDTNLPVISRLRKRRRLTMGESLYFYFEFFLEQLT